MDTMTLEKYSQLILFIDRLQIQHAQGQVATMYNKYRQTDLQPSHHMVHTVMPASGVKSLKIRKFHSSV